MGADTLWRASLTATGRDDVRRFLEWRLRNGLSLAKAAEALGLARRTIAYHSNGERAVPNSILLACTGWEVHAGLRQAA
jgi:DNA-binding XRE family transcriptional regulator